MSSINIVFETPLLLLLLIPVLAIIVVPFLMLPKKRRRSLKKILPMAIHCVVCVLLVLVLSGIKFVRTTDDQAVLLLVDLSDSTESVQESILARADELLAEIDEKTPAGVILFGGDSLYTLKLGTESRNFEIKEVQADSTDMDSALEYAATLLPADKSGHIIIMSDGKETDGDADRTAHRLSTKGIRIDAVYFDSTDSSLAEMQLCSVTGADGAYVGDELQFFVELKSNQSGSAELTLYDNDTPVLTENCLVSEGVNNYVMNTVALSSGVHTYRTEIVPDSDTLVENNEIYTYLKVTGAPAILIIADTLTNAKTLEAVLSSDNEVTVTTAQNAPNSIFELCRYDEVILSNVHVNDLPSKYADLLETYVSTYGRSLLAVGGTDTFMYGKMEGTALEEMLPVTLSLSESAEGNSVALMLVLDCSLSMSNTSTYLSVAKQGAIKVIDAMTDNDYVGVVSFNRSAYLKSKLIPATDSNKESLTRIVSGLTTSQGTYYSEALKLAYQQLVDSDAAVKHIIFLSDGQPSDSGYTTVAKNCAAEGISVSTIGLGYSSNILESLAKTAGGRYYYVSSAKDLPNIMLTETEQVTVSSLITGSFVPVVNGNSELSDIIADATLPAVTGYLGTTLKEGAAACLITEDENPIYAVWTYGLGTVACFTSDLSAKWSADWFKDETALKVVEGMVSTTISDVHHDSSLSTDITVRGKTTDIKVKTRDGRSDITLALSLSGGNATKNYVLIQTEPGIFEVSVETSEVGLYQVIITENDSQGQLLDYLDTAFAVSYSAEYDAFTDNGRAKLENICSYSGGSIFTDMKKLAEEKVISVSRIFNPMVILINVGTIIITLLVLLAPSALVTKISPTKAIQSE